MTEAAREQWRTWAHGHNMGSDRQVEAAVNAALTALAAGSTSDEAASAARSAAESLTTQGQSQRSTNLPAPAGITWDIAMARAGEILDSTAPEPKMLGRRIETRADYMSARTALAQGWIAFARELTMHSRLQTKDG